MGEDGNGIELAVSGRTLAVVVTVAATAGALTLAPNALLGAGWATCPALMKLTPSSVIFLASTSSHQQLHAVTLALFVIFHRIARILLSEWKKKLQQLQFIRQPAPEASTFVSLKVGS